MLPGSGTSHPLAPSRKRKWNATNVTRIDFGDSDSDSELVSTAVVQQASRDGRRVERTLYSVPMPRDTQTVAEPYTYVPTDGMDVDFEIDVIDGDTHDKVDDPGAAYDVGSFTPGSEPTLNISQDNPLRIWGENRDMYLQEMVRRNGRAEFRTNICCVCDSKGTCSPFFYGKCRIPLLIHFPGPLYRCADCFWGFVVCGSCICTAHKSQPFHRIKVILHAPKPFNGLIGFRYGLGRFLRIVAFGRPATDSNLDTPSKTRAPTPKVERARSSSSTSMASMQSTSRSALAVT